VLVLPSALDGGSGRVAAVCGGPGAIVAVTAGVR